MKRVGNLIALVALGVLIAGCETSMNSWFDDDDPPAADANLTSVAPQPNTGFATDSGRYPPQQRYYELTMDGFPSSTRCKVENAQGRVSNRGTGKRIAIVITGYPSTAEVECSMSGLPEFVIDTNRWAFTQPRRPGLSPGDVEKVYVTVVYSLTNAKLRPIAEMTMNTAAGTFKDRFALDTVKRRPSAFDSTQPQYNPN